MYNVQVGKAGVGQRATCRQFWQRSRVWQRFRLCRSPLDCASSPFGRGPLLRPWTYSQRAFDHKTAPQNVHCNACGSSHTMFCALLAAHAPAQET